MTTLVAKLDYWLAQSLEVCAVGDGVGGGDG